MEAEKKQVLTLQAWLLAGLVFVSFAYNRFAFSIEMVAVITVFVILWQVKRQTLFMDLMPLLILFLAFQAFPGNAAYLSIQDIHIRDVIQFEKDIFGGTLPSYWLRTTVYPSAFGSFLTAVTNLFYISHFVVPIIISLVLWHRQRVYYWQFITGLSLLSFVGIGIYILYPAAPPWWAAENGYLVDQPVNLISGFKILDVLVRHNPNPVAAMPSLHMAFPTYIALFCVAIWGRRARWLFWLPLLVGFSAVYLGHHFVVDLIAGAALSVCTMGGVLLASRFLSQKDEILSPIGY
jgi:membrane-associated phospholipid phosphatase